VTRIRSVLLCLAPVICALTPPGSLRAQTFPDPTTQWQAAPSEGQLPGWQFVANALSLPPEFLPVPAATNPSQRRSSPPPTN
jgi:hypothetical protein